LLEHIVPKMSVRVARSLDEVAQIEARNIDHAGCIAVYKTPDIGRLTRRAINLLCIVSTSMCFGVFLNSLNKF